jgi:hypothetical protein
MNPLFVVCAIAPDPVKTHNSKIVSMDLIFSLKRMQDKKSVTHIWATRTLSLSEKPRTSSATVPLPKKEEGIERHFPHALSRRQGPQIPRQHVLGLAVILHVEARLFVAMVLNLHID